MKSAALIEQLLAQTNALIRQAEHLKRLDLPLLTWKENQSSWHILACLEHLNLYGDFYLPEMERKISKAPYRADLDFKSGMLGKYFANSMLPKAKLNKMKTFKNKDPMHQDLGMEVIDRFIGQQIKLVELLHQSSNKSLNRIKIRSSISPLLRFKLGDTFQFYINHMLRHFTQIDRIKTAYKNQAF